MTDQGEFKYCEEQSNCTVTCSAGRKTPTTTARNHQLPWKVVLVLEMIVVVENGMLVLDLIVIVVKSLRLP